MAGSAVGMFINTFAAPRTRVGCQVCLLVVGRATYKQHELNLLTDTAILDRSRGRGILDASHNSYSRCSWRYARRSDHVTPG